LSPQEEYLRNTPVSDPTRAILKARETGEEPTVEGAPSALGEAVKAITKHVTEGAGGKKEEKPPAAVTTSSSTPAATVPKPEPVKDAVKPATKPPKPDNPKGAAGVPRSATQPRKSDELPDITDKPHFNPRLLVELARTNSPLHDQIVSAAQAAGISSGEYANIVMAASNGDPNASKNGRMGYAGLTEADGRRYQQMYPDLFRDSQGQPVDIKNPVTNMLVGALKYREMSDIYGSRTPSSVAAYWLGPGRVDEISRMSPSQQRERLGETRELVRKSIDPDAKEGSAPANLRITDQGTMTAQGAGQALIASAKAGDPMIVASYMADTLPRGMSSNDGWKHLEARMVGTYIMAGDLEGANKARELVFQMSQVGATQALMRADRDLRSGDLHGAAQQLARAYFFAPDGGLAKFSVTKDGLYGQRYNEATRQPIGNPFQVDSSRIQAMLNITRDPQTYLKTVQESRKTNAEIEAKAAETAYKRAQTKYTGELLPSLERRADVAAEARALGDLARFLKPGASTGQGGKVDARVAEINQQINHFFPNKDAGQEIPMNPELAIQQDIFKSLMLNNDQMAGGGAKDIAIDLITKPNGGRFKLDLANDGGLVVSDRKTNARLGYLNPYVAQRLGVRANAAKAAPAAAPASPIGATPRSAPTTAAPAGY